MIQEGVGVYQEARDYHHQDLSNSHRNPHRQTCRSLLDLKPGDSEEGAEAGVAVILHW